MNDNNERNIRCGDLAVEVMSKVFITYGLKKDTYYFF